MWYFYTVKNICLLSHNSLESPKTKESLAKGMVISGGELGGQEYCVTGNFRNVKISRIWAIGNFAISLPYYSNIHVQEYFREYRDIRDIFLHANIAIFVTFSCTQIFAVIQ